MFQRSRWSAGHEGPFASSSPTYILHDDDDCFSASACGPRDGLTRRRTLPETSAAEKIDLWLSGRLGLGVKKKNKTDSLSAGSVRLECGAINATVPPVFLATAAPASRSTRRLCFTGNAVAVSLEPDRNVFRKPRNSEIENRQYGAKG